MSRRLHRARYVGPNVIAVMWRQSGHDWTLYRSVPGDAIPRLTWTRSGGAPADTSISEPSRFGQWAPPSDPRSRKWPLPADEARVFEEWADAFIGDRCDCHQPTGQAVSHDMGHTVHAHGDGE